MGATPIWRMSISQQNKDVNDIINEWTEKGGREASDKACKAIREYYKRNQLIHSGVRANSNEAFIQQAEYENNFITPLDNIPVAKLHEADLTEKELDPLNEEQAVELVNKIRASKIMILENEKFVTNFFNVVDVYDERLRKKVPTIQNTEYERRRKEQEREAFEKERQERLQRLQAQQAEQERIMAQERESDSNKTLEQLASDIVTQIESGNYNDQQIVAVKLGISVPEVNLLSRSTYNLNREVTEKLVAPVHGYATSEQREEYDRKKTAEAAERQREEREYERQRTIQRLEEEKRCQEREAELKRQQEEKERQEFEYEVNSLVKEILNPKSDVYDSILFFNGDTGITANDVERIRAIPSEEERKAEAIRYAEENRRQDRELIKRPIDEIHKTRNEWQDKNYYQVVLTRDLLNPEVSTEQILSKYPDEDNFHLTPEIFYKIKKMTNDPELQKVEAKTYAERQVKARRKRIDKKIKEEEEEEAKAAKPIKNRDLKH